MEPIGPVHDGFMFSQRKATHITSGNADDADTLHILAGHYAYPAMPSSAPCLGKPYFRVNFVSSIDGAVTHNGKSGELGGPGDKAVFRVLRGLADVVLVGARTALTENYRQPQPDSVFTSIRNHGEQAPRPRSRCCHGRWTFPVDYPPLTHPDTMIFTCEAAPADRRQALTDAGATVIACGDDAVDPERVGEVCCETRPAPRALRGGPSLLGTLIAADLVDELC